MNPFTVGVQLTACKTHSYARISETVRSSSASVNLTAMLSKASLISAVSAILDVARDIPARVFIADDFTPA